MIDGPPNRARPWVWAVPATLCAVVGGLPLARKPLFRDETATYLYTRLSLPDLLHATGHVDRAFLPYYALLHLTPDAAAHPVALRLWSLAAAIGTAAVVAATAALLYRPWIGLLAGVALCLNGAFLEAADTARPEALAMLGCAIATYLLVRARTAPLTRKLLAGYVLALGLAGLGTLFATLTVLAHALLAAAWFARSDRGRLVRLGAAMGAAVVPAGVLLLTSGGQQAQLGWVRTASASGAWRAMTFQSGQQSWPASTVLVAALVVVVLGSALRRAVGILVGPALLIVPAAALWLMSQLIRPVEVPRYLVVAPVGAALLIGAALEVQVRPLVGLRFRSAWLVGAATGVVLLVVVALVQLPQVRQRYSANSLDAFPALDARLARLVHPGERLVVAQNYASIGTVTGVALYAHDTGLLAAQSQAAPDGTRLLFVRRVLHTSPLRTAPAALAPGSLWVLGEPTNVPATADPAVYWRAQLLRAGCRPTGPPALRYHGSALQRWHCTDTGPAHTSDRST